MNFYCNFLNRKEKLQFDANSVGFALTIAINLFVNVHQDHQLFHQADSLQEKGVGWMGLGGRSHEELWWGHFIWLVALTSFGL